jgi:thiol-disulfide isomerase/thioredoxin
MPLVTLWTASWCSTCKVVAPLVQSVVESGVGEAEGGIGYCTVEYDAPDIMTGGFGMQYMITSIPSLFSFDAQDVRSHTKVVDAKKLTDRLFLEEWIRNEARQYGNRSGGDNARLFGGLFGSWR